MSKESKSTNKEMVQELIALNVDGRFDQIIENAKNNRYHDFKNPDDVPCGKVQFLADTQVFAVELQDVRQRLMNGEFDESADEQDIESMRDVLIMDNSPDVMFEQLGFKVPTAAERAFKKAKTKFHNDN